uniref:MAP kinase-activating death domain protein n=1 Tax=Macrostomum lignano TaxID=282301 RepID=A0A1I8JLU7_9PLAT
MSGGGGGGGGASLNSLAAEKPLCPRLADYLVLVGARLPAKQNSLAQTPQLLRRYPPQDHRDFHLPPDIVFFCQPEGCLATGPKRRAAAGSGGSSGSRECSTFVFTLTEKDSGLVRYGICHNFYRPIDRRWTAAEAAENGGGSAERVTSRSRSRLLTSLCLVSHHPFFSRFRECLQVLRRIVNACSERSQAAGRTPNRETVWSVLTGLHPDSSSQLVMHDVREIETWILRLLSAPVPVPGRTKLQLTVLPEADYPPLVFALPDRSRLSLADFPLHLPLELLGVDTCLRVLTCILLENKLVLQSRDENALTMSVMAFVAMLYPMQYMFPVIPLLPTCMMSAEQLLLAPTPYIIGLPASFLLYKKNFCLPPDVWLVDLDANKIVCAQDMGKLPSLPEPEGSQLRSQLQQALAMMNEAAQQQPIKNLDTVANQDAEFLTCHHQQPTPAAVASGNDVDSVDVAARVAMVRFFNSPNVLGNFAEHTRTLRLYPRPVVAFQYFAFVQSRPRRCDFTDRLARTQAVEYFAEWSLCPDNCAFQRIHTGLTDPTAIGDKHKWFSQQLQRLQFSVCRQPPETCTLKLCYEPPNYESGCSDSEPASSGAQPLPASTSYASLTDFVSEIISSDIVGDPNQLRQSRSAARLVIDAAEDAFQPPDSLQLPPSAAGRTGGEDSSGDNSSGEDTELTD